MTGRDDVPSQPEAAPALTDEQALAHALALARAGLPFEAHEACEDRWRLAQGVDRQAWRALAQWGAALTHESRGNRKGARSVAFRAREGLVTCDPMPTWLAGKAPNGNALGEVLADLDRLTAT